MKLSSVPIPDVYKRESADFRFFLKWFEYALSKTQYDTEEFFDLLDPLRCPEDLLWMLGDTMGYKYDSRMTTAFNRLVLVYFMSMIRLKGCKDGLTLAAQVNLDQFKLQNLAEGNPILNNRLEDTSIPSNSVYIQPHPEEGYIDVIYFSDKIPTDVCTEYVRPVGMYMVPHAGVRYDAKSRLSIDARLTDTRDLNISIGPTHVGHYSYDDYSRMQRLSISDLDEDGHVIDTDGKRRSQRNNSTYPKLSDMREYVWYRNSKYEGDPNPFINPGYRSLYSLQLVNGEESSRSLTGVRNVASLSPFDVSVFDEQGNIYDQDYFVEEFTRSQNSMDYVEPNIMGTLGGSMDTIDLNTTSDSEDR